MGTRVGASSAGFADHDRGASRGVSTLRFPTYERRQGHRNRTGNMAIDVFVILANVDEECTAGQKRLQLVHVDLVETRSVHADRLTEVFGTIGVQEVLRRHLDRRDVQKVDDVAK
jgi:hypothetical protein